VKGNEIVAASLGRRAIVVAATAAVAGLPVLTGSAAAATDFRPDFAASSFTTGSADSPEAFPTVAARAGHVVALPSLVRVKFPDAIKLTQVGNHVTNDDNTAAAPYFVDPATPGTHLDGTDAIDPDDPSILDVIPPRTLPDGDYELHVSAFEASNCPDATLSDVALPSCPPYDDFVDDQSGPFQFTIDQTGPSVAIQTINGVAFPLPRHLVIDANHVGNLTLAGLTSADTKSVRVSVRSSSGGPTRVIAAVVTPHAGQPSTWSAHDDLGAMLDGALTFTATGRDTVDNVGRAAHARAPLAAHPTAPRSLRVRPADSGATLTWRPPRRQTAGHPVTGYLVTAADRARGGRQVTTHVSCAAACPTAATIHGLTNGHVYAVSLAAVTGVGGHGAAAHGRVRPRSATVLTLLAKPHTVRPGDRVVLTGRVSTRSTGRGLSRVTLHIVRKLGHGRVSRQRLVVHTDTFGVWSTTVRPARTTTYEVRWAGNRQTLPSRADRVVRVR
jgi:hypothetical protein